MTQNDATATPDTDGDAATTAGRDSAAPTDRARDLGSVTVERETLPGGASIAVVTLNRPEKLNGLTVPILEGLVDAAAELRKDRSLRGVVVAGAGRSFCAGLDFGSVLKDPVYVARKFVPGGDGMNLFQRANGAWRNLPVPVVAGVHGHCFGGGLQLALNADFRVTVADARWSVLEAKWGLIPDMSGVRPLTDAVGADQAKWLTMSGEEVPGARAAELGLATAAVDSLADAHAHARSLLTELAQRSPDQLAASKRLFNNATRSPRAAWRAERFEQVKLFLRENTNRARVAGLKKAAPQFTRRGTWVFGRKK